MDSYYYRVIQLLSEIKLVQGNTALNSTLRRHSDLKKYLLEHQVSDLQAFEEELKTH